MSYTVARAVLNIPGKKHLTVLLKAAVCKSSLRNYARCLAVLHIKHRDNECFRNTLLKTNQPHNMLAKYHLTSQRSNPKESNENSTNKGILSYLIQSKVLTIPNVLTVSRILLTPYLGYLVAQNSYSTALSLFVVAGFTDLLDGLIARSFKSQTSSLGSFLDPLADKLLISTLFVTLTYADLIPVYLLGLVLVRDALLVSAASYVRYSTLDPRPRNLREFFDPTNHTVKLQPTLSSKFNTVVQLSLVAVTLASPVFGFVDHQLVHALWYLTALTTVTSGIGYIFAKDTIKYVSKNYTKKHP